MPTRGLSSEVRTQKTAISAPFAPRSENSWMRFRELRQGRVGDGCMAMGSVMTMGNVGDGKMQQLFLWLSWAIPGSTAELELDAPCRE
mmetsp:Transcript_10049/g.20089  ORF Transcript_10049/g.20089 Transcript_10049/m.20089 type:complete len:88 (+) Transcript_10049:195-458(+)